MWAIRESEENDLGHENWCFEDATNYRDRGEDEYNNDFDFEESDNDDDGPNFEDDSRGDANPMGNANQLYNFEVDVNQEFNPQDIPDGDDENA